MYISFNQQAKDRYDLIMLNDSCLCYMSKHCVCIQKWDGNSAEPQNNKDLRVSTS